jgi:glycosyltransferase involved in cell wall biosynthesis
MYERQGPADAARERFGLDPDGATVLFFGRMRAYKGLDTLCDAVRLISRRGGQAPTLMLAGPVKDDQRAEIERQLPTDSRVIAEFGFVDEAEVRDWFDAADVAVFPFRAILNSSSIKLSATLGVPAILPGLPHLRREFADESWARFFDLDDPAASLADLLTAGDPGDHRTAMEAYTRRYSPQIVSRAYADLLLELTA